MFFIFRFLSQRIFLGTIDFFIILFTKNSMKHIFTAYLICIILLGHINATDYNNYTYENFIIDFPR